MRLEKKDASHKEVCAIMRDAVQLSPKYTQVYLHCADEFYELDKDRFLKNQSIVETQYNVSVDTLRIVEDLIYVYVYLYPMKG